MADEGRTNGELAPERLRWTCDEACFDFETTDELPCRFEIIGQGRAVEAIELGVAVRARGYNVFVQGLTGTGKETTVKCILEQVAAASSPPGDKCYVYNFDDPDRPLVLALGRGEGSSLRRDMEHFVEYMEKTVPAVLESEEFKKRRTAVMETEGQEGRRAIGEFEDRIRKENFVLAEVRYGPVTKTEVAAVVDGKPRTTEDLERMLAKGEIGREEFERLREKGERLAAELEDVLRHAREVERQIAEALRRLVLDMGARIVDPVVGALKEKYEGEKVRSYLDRVRRHALDNLERFVPRPGGDGGAIALAGLAAAPRDRFLEYRVNVIVDNAASEKAPVIVETHPTYRNLFGSVERTWDRSGQSYTDFTKIRAGSLVRADGGFVVLSLLDVLAEPGVYPSLKRTLKSGKVDIQGYDPLFVFASTAMRPEPIDVDVKVVLIGDADSYRLLYVLDPDFRKIFKIKADFDDVMERTDEAVLRYAEFVRRIADEEKLRAFHRDGVAAVVEHGVRLAGRQTKMTTRFSDIADLVREADYWAAREGAGLVRRGHVETALEAKVRRLNLLETKIRELIEQDVLMIDVDGERVGQVNGLSVYDLGDYRFGRPVKITAAVATGREGLINIEREANLSGKTHDKGMLILAGYFRSRFARERPLSLAASVAFEQSYSGVDGDSASSTELYALVSALTELPLRQDIAVTGSVNQKGEVQAIGGVNEKIEGFFDVCRAKGLTGSQGVIIPEANVPHLMLRKDVVEAVAEGRFHIYPVRTVEDGLAILTGRPAGERGPDGTYPEGTVYRLVDERLAELGRGLQRFLRASRPGGTAEPSGAGDDGAPARG